MKFLFMQTLDKTTKMKILDSPIEFASVIHAEKVLERTVSWATSCSPGDAFILNRGVLVCVNDSVNDLRAM